ncbi:unnamed protein product [Withania somnifera]
MGTHFFINDNHDVLIEILRRLDGRSLGVAACVCKLWCNVAQNDSLWEHLCFRHVSEGVRTVVLALGGYRRLYMVCVRPVLNRLRKGRPIGVEESDAEIVARVYWTRHEVELSLSLFCVDYYERVLLSGGGHGGDGGCTSSLMFLCKPVNV